MHETINAKLEKNFENIFISEKASQNVAKFLQRKPQANKSTFKQYFLAKLGKKFKKFAMRHFEMLWSSLYLKDEEDERVVVGVDLHDLPGPRPGALLPREAALLPPPPPSVRFVNSRGRNSCKKSR